MVTCSRARRLTGYTGAGVERLHYNNPYGQVMERVWFDGKIVFAVELGEVEVESRG